MTKRSEAGFASTKPTEAKNETGFLETKPKEMRAGEANKSDAVTFSKYRKSDGKARVLLLYLILNNYDLEMVEEAIEVIQSKPFGLEFRKIYGETTEFVDIRKIEAELASIRVPIICSPQSYEIYSTAETIHAYRAKIPEKPLYINDMGVIAPLMIITENCIVSSNMAATVESTDEKGFMYFVDYVLKGDCTVGEWNITYKNKEFCVYYTSKKDGNDIKELLYHALELDQTSTFKLVLYIIRKAVGAMEEFPPDNFEEETWRLESKT